MRRTEITGGAAPMAVTPYYITDDGAPTSVELLPGVDGKRTSLHGFTLNTDVEGRYELLIGSEVIWSGVIPTGVAGGTFSEKFEPFYLEGDAVGTGADLTLNKPASADVSITFFAGQA